jgi:DNA-binding transcriptional MerR regulator
MNETVEDPRRGRKSPGAYRTISEVADELQVPQHVLRFWETKFPQIRPLKRGGGRRYYRPEDILLLRRISTLLYVQGYTIKGVQRLLREGGSDEPTELAPPEAAEPEADEPAADARPQLALPGMPEAPSPAAKPVVRVRAESAASRAAAAAPAPAPTPVPVPPDDAALAAAEAEIARLRALLAGAAAELRAMRDQLARALPAG